MRLFHTPTSPFVRKVLVAAHELGLADRVEPVLLRPSPLEADPALSAHNPLNKIPALVLDDGETLYDSAVIVEYLDALGPAPRLIPARGMERFRALRAQALADGVLEAGILVFYEHHHRPEERRFDGWVRGQAEKVRQGLDALDALSASFGDEAGLAQICAGVALGWLEFRRPVGDVFAGRPRLAGWYERFRERPSMRATEPRS